MTEPLPRILALHAFYQVPGGEDQVHRTEVAHLRERGHEVLDVTVENAQLATLGTAGRLRATVSNPATAAMVAEHLREFRPDVAYVNNVFPGLSGSVIEACRAHGVPVVRVLHNYRFACVSANLFRDGKFCDSCVGNPGVAGIVHGCYRDSRAVSAVATLARRVDRKASAGAHVIAISRYVRDVAERAGMDAARITVRPNLTVPGDASPADSDAAPREVVVFAGRDTPEKGLPDLLTAFALLRERRPGALLQIVGPEAPRELTPGIQWLGRLPHREVTALMAGAGAVAVPSVWPEPFGLVAVEALAAGTPVVAAASGGLAELEGDAVRLHTPGSPQSLADALDATLALPRADAAQSARARYATDFSPDTWYRLTIEAFAGAMEDARG